MKNGLFHFIALALLTLFFAFSASAAFEGYLPMPRAEFAKKRGMKHLLTIPTPAELLPEEESSEPKRLPEWHFPQAGASGVTLRLVSEEDGYPEEWVFEGIDKAGKPWKVYTGSLYSAAGGAEIYRADLDRNGIQDVIMLVPNAGNGMAPDSRLEIITFEQDGRPVLLETWGFYYSTDKKGIDDLLDLKGNGRAQLLTMHFSDGYWITDLYQVADARWQRVTGRFGKLSYPVLTRFTHRPNQRVVHTVKVGRHPTAPDLSNVRSINAVRYQLGDDEKIQFETDDGRFLSSWLRSMVLTVDSPQGRRILSGTADGLRRKEALSQLINDRQPARFYGSLDEDGGDGPFTLWVSE